MDKILEVREKDLLVKVQPGVTRTQLNKELKNMAYSSPWNRCNTWWNGCYECKWNNNSQMRVMRDQVRNLEVVLTDVCVPISELAETVVFARKELNSIGLLIQTSSENRTYRKFR